MDIAIIGTGAIGGYYGARLAHSGHNVHFLMHSEYEYVKAHGLSIKSHLGDFSLSSPNVYKDIADMPLCDLVCIAVKATANEHIFPLIKPVLKDDCPIMLLQNGFGYEQKLAELYPGHPIFGGLCFISSFREGPGVVRHTDYGAVTFAPLNETDYETLVTFASLFIEAGVETILKRDLTEARIRKLMWNIPYNGMSVISNCKTDVLANNPAMRSAIYAVMQELLEAANACRSPLEASFADAMVKSTDDMSPYSPSMRLDYLAGRAMEIDAIYGNMIEYAARHGYDMRYARMMKWQLEYLESINPNSK